MSVLSREQKSYQEEESAEGAYVRRQIEACDPDDVTVTLCFSEDDHVVRTLDWKRLGEVIGRNTCLKGLILLDGCVESKQDLNTLFRGVSSNRSIEMLGFHSDLFDGEVFNILVSFFKNNHNFELLRIQQHHLGSDGVRSLAASLEEFDSLKEFELFSHLREYDKVEPVIRALSGHSGLRKLLLMGKSISMDSFAELTPLLPCPSHQLAVVRLSSTLIDDKRASILARGLAENNTLIDLNLAKNTNITGKGWASILAALQSSRSSLEKLTLDDNNFGGAAERHLTSAVANSTLKCLNLRHCRGISITVWRNLFLFLQNTNCILVKLSLGGCKINNRLMHYLANGLGSNSTLRYLDLSENTTISTAGYQALSSALQNPNSALEELKLFRNRITDRIINSLASGLEHNNRLKELNLACNRDVTAAGWQVFSAIFSRPNCALEKVNICLSNEFSITDQTVIALANSLASNATLKELILQVFGSISDNAWSAFSHVLCNTSSIIDTFQRSNHTLQKLCYVENRLPEELRTLLLFNRENSKSEAARLKIIRAHFHEGFTVPPFVDMDLKVLPHAISWMGKGGTNNGHLYKFLRSMPILFDANCNSNKRKRGT